MKTKEKLQIFSNNSIYTHEINLNSNQIINFYKITKIVHVFYYYFAAQNK